MQSNLKKAKKFFIVNIASNLLAVLSNSLVGIWMTPFLIGKLGLAAFGMVPLVTSISTYLSIFNLTVSGAVGRFVAFHRDKGETEKCRIYFNSSIFGLLGIGVLVGGIALAVSNFLPLFLQIPEGYETDFTLLFLLVVVTSFIGAVTSSFQVSTFVTHKFYVYNVIKIVSRVLQIILVILFFQLLSPSLTMVGAAMLGMTIFMLLSLVVANRKLTPELTVSPRYFRWPALREMGGMGSWIVVDQVGSMLYLHSDLIIINHFLGPEQVGRYAPVIQLLMLLRILAPAIAGVFAPVAIEYIARNDLHKLGNHTQTAIKFMGLMLALPVGLICGFAEPFLNIWLGPSFAGQAYLVWILLLPQVLFLAFNPLYNINRGMNKVKVPALVTIAGGVLNIIFAVVLIQGFQLGLLGMALASVLCFGLRTVCFMPVYTARLLGAAGNFFFKSVPSSLVLTGMTFGLALLIQQQHPIRHINGLVAFSSAVVLAYSLLVFTFFLNSYEKELVFSLFGIKKKILKTEG